MSTSIYPNLELIENLKGHKGRVWNASWRPDGRTLATCGEDKTVRLWSQSGGHWVNNTILADGHSRTIRQTSWSKCGNFLASASFDGTTAIWDKKSGEFECNATLEGHENEVKSVAWSNSGNYLATCSRDKSVWIWEVGDDDEYECAAVLNAHTQDVKKVIWHPLQDVVVSCSYDNTIKFFSLDVVEDDWSCFATLYSHESTVWSISFRRDGTQLASCSDDKTLRIWHEVKPGMNNYTGSGSQPQWKLLVTLSGYHSRTIYDVDWCHLTDFIATACADDSIRIFKDVTINEPEFQIIATVNRAHTQDVNCVAWNPSIFGLLVSVSDDGFIHVWQLQNYIDCF